MLILSVYLPRIYCFCCRLKKHSIHVLKVDGTADREAFIYMLEEDGEANREAS